MQQPFPAISAQVGAALPVISRTMGYPVLKSRTWSGINPIHWDPEYARALGFPGPLVTGQIFTAYMQEMAVGFFGTHFFERSSFDCRYVKPGYLGDTVKTGGVITDREPVEGGVKLTADVWCENQDGVRIVTGVITCVTPAA